jgi:hypothetical protein
MAAVGEKQMAVDSLVLPDGDVLESDFRKRDEEKLAGTSVWFPGRPEHERRARSAVVMFSLGMRESASGRSCALSHSGKAARSLGTRVCKPEGRRHTSRFAPGWGGYPLRR